MVTEPDGVGAREHDPTTSFLEYGEWRNTLNETTEDAAAESRQRETRQDGWPSFFHREIARKSEGDGRGTYRFKKDLGDKAITMDRPTNKWVMWGKLQHFLNNWEFEKQLDI